MVGARAICLSGQKHERRDEEGVSIDTIHNHNFFPSIDTFRHTSPSLHSALHAVGLVVAHLQLHLQQPQPGQSGTSQARGPDYMPPRDSQQSV